MFANRKTNRSFRPTVEHLEERALMSLVPPLPPPPDHIGGTPANAYVVDLPLMAERTVSDNLGLANDVDMIKVQLNAGDFLMADADRTGGALSSQMNVLNAQGNLVTSGVIRPGTEPGDSTQLAIDPALGFYAPATDTYFIKLATTAADQSYNRGYDLHLERIGRTEDGYLAALDQGGSFHVWRNQNGNLLNVVGPKGMGFQLYAPNTWSATSDSGVTTYQTSGPFQLRTGALGDDVPLSNPGNAFKVVCSTPGWAQLGTLVGTQGSVGVALDPYMQHIRDRTGIDLQNATLGSSWKIMTGGQVLANYPQYDYLPVHSGVPYFVYDNVQGSVTANLGTVQFTKAENDPCLFILDPTDPMFYMAKDMTNDPDLLLGGSLKRRLEIPNLPLPGAPINALPETGHVLMSLDLPATDLPVKGLSVRSEGRLEVGMNLDANADGLWLDGAHIADFFRRGSFDAPDNVLADLKLGVHGHLDVTCSFGSFSVTYPLCHTTLFVDGQAQGGVFRGGYGSTVASDNPYGTTPLAFLQPAASTTYEGYAYRDGRFSVTGTHTCQFATTLASLSVTVSSQGSRSSTTIQATGHIATAVYSADIGGSLGLDGSFSWFADAAINLGGGDNYLRGSARLTIARANDQISESIDTLPDAPLEFQCTVGPLRIRGKVSGNLTVTESLTGIRYDCTLYFDGEVDANGGWGWNKVASLSGSIHADNQGLVLHSDRWGDFRIAW